MRHLFITLFLLAVACTINAQPVVGTFNKAGELGISFTELDSVYLSAVNVQPEKAVFKENQKEFMAEYRKMMASMGTFLTDNGFEWGEKTRFFQRIYFDRSGTIDYYFVHLDRTNFSDNKKTQLQSLLQEFSAQYTFPLSGSSNFAQCSPIVFADPKVNNINAKN